MERASSVRFWRVYVIQAAGTNFRSPARVTGSIIIALVAPL
jgi:hypothetical protein